MYGTLTVKKVLTNTFSLTIYDIQKHLENIQEVDFEPSKSGGDYFDVVMDVYREADASGSAADTFMTGLVRKELIKLFNTGDVDIRKKVKSLGATELDFALLGNDSSKIKEWAAKSTETSPYVLAKQIRFLEVAKEFPSFDPYAISVSVGDTSLPLGQLKYTAFKYSPHSLVQSSPSTLFINIQSAGDKAWNYTRPNEWLKHIKPFFHTTVLCGDGVTYLLAKDILNFLNLSKERMSAEIDFAFVRINMHDGLDNKALEPIIGEFPSFGKETLYVISSCHSGQYHKMWPEKGGHLLTTSGEDENSYTTNSDKVKYLSRYVKGAPDALSLLTFFGKEYLDSTPHLTASIGDKSYKNQPLREVLKEINPSTQITLAREEESGEMLELPSPITEPFLDSKIFSDGKLQVTTFSIFPPSTDLVTLRIDEPASSSTAGTTTLLTTSSATEDTILLSTSLTTETTALLPTSSTTEEVPMTLGGENSDYEVECCCIIL